MLHLASTASLTMIDVSEPSENLLWEIAGLIGRPGARCLFVGNYDKVRRLGTQVADVGSRPALASQMWTLLDGAEILAYTTDRLGVARFSRAMRAMLLTRSHRDRLAARPGAESLP